MTSVSAIRGQIHWARGVIAGLLLLWPLHVTWAGDSVLADPAKIPGTALVMVTSPSCPWCDAFEDDVGHLYDKTIEAQKFPLYRVDFFSKFPQSLSHIPPAQFTPTFIVLEDYKEIGRLEGYPGDEMFWWRFSEFTE